MEISTKALESLIQRAKAKLREKIELKEKKKDNR
jgi:DNA-directed RNA polymerase specialized sigma24 family protein